MSSLNIVIPNVDIKLVTDACIKHGFGLESTQGPHGDTKYIEVWTTNDYEGTGQPGGFRVGTIAQGLHAFSTVGRFEMTDHMIGREEGRVRLAALFTTIITKA